VEEQQQGYISNLSLFFFFFLSFSSVAAHNLSFFLALGYSTQTLRLKPFGMPLFFGARNQQEDGHAESFEPFPNLPELKTKSGKQDVAKLLQVILPPLKQPKKRRKRRQRGGIFYSVSFSRAKVLRTTLFFLSPPQKK
jgi:hypothetical protein